MKKWACVLCVCYFAIICLAGYFCFVAITHPIKYTDEIKVIANEYTLPPYLLASVINVESGFRKNAKSNKNALGLMQIKLSTANFLNEYYKLDELLDEKKLLNPEINIRYGGMYLKYLLNKFGDINTTLAAYNAGETRVMVWLKEPQYSNEKSLKYIPFKETREYVKKVNKNIKFYKKWL